MRRFSPVYETWAWEWLEMLSMTLRPSLSRHTAKCGFFNLLPPFSSLWLVIFSFELTVCVMHYNIWRGSTAIFAVWPYRNALNSVTAAHLLSHPAHEMEATVSQLTSTFVKKRRNRSKKLPMAQKLLSVCTKSIFRTVEKPQIMSFFLEGTDLSRSYLKKTFEQWNGIRPQNLRFVHLWTWEVWPSSSNFPLSSSSSFPFSFSSSFPFPLLPLSPPLLFLFVSAFFSVSFSFCKQKIY